jgi:hypothetical protein
LSEWDCLSEEVDLKEAAEKPPFFFGSFLLEPLSRVLPGKIPVQCKMQLAAGFPASKIVVTA